MNLFRQQHLQQSIRGSAIILTRTKLPLDYTIFIQSTCHLLSRLWQNVSYQHLQTQCYSNKYSCHWSVMTYVATLSYFWNRYMTQVRGTFRSSKVVPSMKGMEVTIFWISKLFTENTCIHIVPKVTAYGAPSAIHTNFNSSKTWIEISCWTCDSNWSTLTKSYQRLTWTKLLLT